MVPVEGRGRFRATPAQFGEGDMARCGIVTAAIGVAFGLLTGVPASAWDRGDVDVLAVFPDVTPGQPSSVEGLTRGPAGHTSLPTFGCNTPAGLSRHST